MAPKQRKNDSAKKVKDLKPKATNEVQGGTRASKSQSNISAKYSQTADGIAQNFK